MENKILNFFRRIFKKEIKVDGKTFKIDRCGFLTYETNFFGFLEKNYKFPDKIKYIHEAYLDDYEFELPESLESTYSMNLYNYKNKLPDFFKETKYLLYLKEYNFELPKNFEFYGLYLNIENYKYPLPKNIRFKVGATIVCNSVSVINILEICKKHPSVKIIYCC
jgi:hypothetical protein